MKNNYVDKCIDRYGFCFIAEISNNHLRDLDRYFKLIDAACNAGAHAVKVQTYTTDSLIAPNRFSDLATEGPWKGQPLRDLYESIGAPLEWTERIFEYAEIKGIYLFSSPFSVNEIDLLEKLGCPAYKIASFEFTDINLWDSLIHTGKPLLASTGIADSQVIEMILSRPGYTESLSVLFNCVSSYPCTLDDLDVYKLRLLDTYPCHLGLSDHSLEASSCIYAYAKGARVFEKHLTLSRKDGGPDALFSLEPDELRMHISILQQCANVERDVAPSLPKGHSYGRSVYATSEIRAGDMFTSDNIGSYRPNQPDGISAQYYQSLIGRHSVSDYNQGEFIYTHELPASN